MRLVQKAVIKNGDKFLILLRGPGAKKFPYYWDFPGGKLELNEEPFSGIEREVMEETSLKVKALKVIGIYEFDFENKGEKTHRFTVYSTKIISGNIKISFEHIEFRWATKEEILKLKIEPFMKAYFEEHR